jgi:hypothetical protein
MSSLSKVRQEQTRFIADYKGDISGITHLGSQQLIGTTQLGLQITELRRTHETLIFRLNVVLFV